MKTHNPVPLIFSLFCNRIIAHGFMGDRMKKFLILFAVLALAAGFAAADEDEYYEDEYYEDEDYEDEDYYEDNSLGLTVGLEFGIYNINKRDDRNMQPYLYPSISYWNSFFDGKLALSAALGPYIGFYDVELEDGGSTKYVGLYFDLQLTYNLYLGSASTLSFSLENAIDKLDLNPRRKKTYDGANAVNMVSYLYPGIGFNQEVEGLGGFYARAILSIIYLQDWYDRTPLNLKTSIGWNSEFGLGLWIQEELALNDLGGRRDPGHTQLSFGLSYWSSLFSADVEVDIPTKFDQNGGITITPSVQFPIPVIEGLSVWLKLEISSIGAKSWDWNVTPPKEYNSDVGISPSIGINYSF